MSLRTTRKQRSGIAKRQISDEAQFILGKMYREGKGVTQDIAKAVKWYRQAGDQGAVDAQMAWQGYMPMAWVSHKTMRKQ